MSARLPEDGSIFLDEGFVENSQDLYEQLATSITWDDRMRARKAASFGVPYDYSGIEWPAAPMPDSIGDILERVAERVGFRPNNCLAHFYPDGSSTMGLHSDSTEDLEPGTGIGIVSLGTQRLITFRNRNDRRLEHYALSSGSLLYMTPEMQADWKHGILAAQEVAGGRISLTFRRMKAG